jgi:thiol-disulfide isomerase/thioredoxin
VLPADEAYAQLRAYLDQTGELLSDTVLSAEREARIDTSRRAILSKFLQFYDTYPTDPRRWSLLLLVLNQKPYFPADYVQAARMQRARAWERILIDTVARHEWERQYTMVRTAFMSAPDVTESQRAELRWWELLYELDGMEKALTRGETIPVRRYQDSLLAFAARFPNQSSYETATGLTHFFFAPPARVADPGATTRFLRLAMASPDTALRNWARNAERLYGAPVMLSGWTLYGDPFDLRRLRGKVVLIDFWGTSCSACISAFPRLKRLYERYHSQGVEFVSVALDRPEDRARVRALVEKHALPWVQIFAGDSTNRYITQYGITGLPNMMILDQKGDLIGRNFFKDRDIAVEFERLLSQDQQGVYRSGE